MRLQKLRLLHDYEGKLRKCNYFYKYYFVKSLSKIVEAYLVTNVTYVTYVTFFGG